MQVVRAHQVQKSVTIARLSAETGLSEATVAFMVRNIDRISPEARDHILKTVQRLERNR